MQLALPRFLVFAVSVAAFGAEPILGQANLARRAPVITVNGVEFATWSDFIQSEGFRQDGVRCGTPLATASNSDSCASDCGCLSTTIRPMYDPTYIFEVPVVVHIIENTEGAGQISDALVQSQIDVLNEDFRALPGSLGENGTDTMIQFHLAQVDPSGNPTTGITRSVNNAWFNDGGDYWAALAWDTNRYMNIYTNSGGGSLGYVYEIPQNGGVVGFARDRVVIQWLVFGRPGQGGPPWDNGRITTHEVGHYFGLFHTFDFGCGSAIDCYTTGDRICDTNPEASATNGCPVSKASCGSPDPTDNYMDYTDGVCLQRFTPEQTNRMRCTIINWRPDVAGTQTFRNAGSNPASYTASSAVPGITWTASVDLSTTGHTFAQVLGYTNPANNTLGAGQVVLVGGTKVFALPLMAAPASWSALIPPDPTLVGLSLYTQAIHVVGVKPFALSNAQDLLIAY